MTAFTAGAEGDGVSGGDGQIRSDGDNGGGGGGGGSKGLRKPQWRLLCLYEFHSIDLGILTRLLEDEKM